MLNTLNLSIDKQTQIKHLTKIINGWSIRDKEIKNGKSVFTRKQCEEWSNLLNNRATEIRINSNTTTRNSNNNSSAMDISNQNKSTTTTDNTITNTTTTNHTNPHITLTTTITPTTSPPPCSVPLSPPSYSILSEMHSRTLLSLCQFQLQIFHSFQKGPIRRLDRWNMRIVLTTSYYLLHMYASDSNIVDVHGSALVIACIYLAGKVSEFFLFLLLFITSFF